MHLALFALIFILSVPVFGYEVTYETDVEGDDRPEIQEQISRAEFEAKLLSPFYGKYMFSRVEITPDNKANVVLNFSESRANSNATKIKPEKDMPGFQIAPFFSGSFYESGVGYKPKDFNAPKQTLKNYQQSGRLQVFFDIGRALRMKIKGRILITAGYYTNILSLTEVNNQRRVTVMPARQFGELNVGIRIKLGTQTLRERKQPLVNPFYD